MRGLIFVLVLLTGCVTTNGGVSYSIQTEYDSSGNITKTIEEWEGKSSTTAGGQSGIKASEKRVDFGIDIPNGAKAYLKAGSNFQGMQSDNDLKENAQLIKSILMMSILKDIPDADKVAALKALTGSP